MSGVDGRYLYSIGSWLYWSTHNIPLAEPLPFSTKLTASSYKHISPKNNILFRADNVFKFHNERTLMFYPGSFTKFFDSTREMEELGGGLTASHLLPTLIEYSGEGNSIAAALLKELGRPDASSIEMDALGFRFFCNRCPRLVLHSWYSIVSVSYSASDQFYSSWSCPLPSTG